jgi:hypothetical protein
MRPDNDLDNFHSRENWEINGMASFSLLILFKDKAAQRYTMAGGKIY